MCEKQKVKKKVIKHLPSEKIIKEKIGNNMEKKEAVPQYLEMNSTS